MEATGGETMERPMEKIHVYLSSKYIYLLVILLARYLNICHQSLYYYIIIQLNYHKREKSVQFFLHFYPNFTSCVGPTFLGAVCVAPQLAQKVAEIILLHLAGQFTKTF